MKRSGEFGVIVRREAAKRADGRCERHLWLTGEICTKRPKEFDHIIPVGLGGKSTLENCAHLCVPCHKAKTHEEDNPRMRKADAQKDATAGVMRTVSRPIQSRGFAKEERPRIEKLPIPPRRDIYGVRTLGVLTPFSATSKPKGR